MMTHLYKTVTLGELVAAVFDATSEYNTDPREVSRLASQAVVSLLRSARRGSISRHYCAGKISTKNNVHGG